MTILRASPAFDAIVLAGGAGRRMDGADKAALEVGQQSLLDRAIAAAAGARPGAGARAGAGAGARTIVVVGPRNRTISSPDIEIIWTREEPVGSGPASAIAHALPMVRQPTVVVLAVDAPFTATAVPRLLDALPGNEAAMLVDEGGRRQPLIAAYTTAALRRQVGDERWVNRSVRSLVEGLQVVEVGAIGAESLDCDTPEDLEQARAAAATIAGQVAAPAAQVAAASPAVATPARRRASSTPAD